MKPVRCISSVILFAAALSSGYAQMSVNGSLSTSFYGFEQFDSRDSSRTVTRAIQRVQLAARSGHVSIQTLFYGLMNVSATEGDPSKLRVAHLFARWKSESGSFTVSMGRVPIFAGVGLGSVDGGLLQFGGSESRVYGSAYGGLFVLPTGSNIGKKNIHDNLVAGGQLVGRLTEHINVGFSYVNRRASQESYWSLRPDSAYQTVNVYVVPENRTEQVMGIDVSYGSKGLPSLYGRYDYDLNAHRTMRGEASGRLSIARDVTLTGDAIYRVPRIPFNSFFAVFPIHPNREFNAGAEFQSKAVSFFTKIGTVRYFDVASTRLSAGTDWNNVSVSYQGLVGNEDRMQNVSARIAIPLLRRALIPTGGIGFANYRLSGDGADEERSYSAMIGLVGRPEKHVSVSLDMQWLRNRVKKNDVRALAKITYWFSHDFNPETELKEGER